MAPSKVGKSILALQLADALMSGTSFLGFTTKSKLTPSIMEAKSTPSILYIQADAPVGDWQEQVKAIAPYGMARTLHVTQESCLSRPEIREKIGTIIAGLKPDLVIWDALYKLGRWELNTPDGIGQALSCLKALSRCPFVLIHHPAKWTVQPGGQGAGTYGAAGSFTLASDASAVWMLTPATLTITGRNVATRTIELMRDSVGRWQTKQRAKRRDSIDDILRMPA